MKRDIVQIDQEKCNGCGACADACAEGAIVMRDGKAWLIRDDYCDGLGACLPGCPVDAIRIIHREADAFDEEAVKARLQELEQEEQKGQQSPCQGGCPGSQAQTFKPAAQPAGQAVYHQQTAQQDTPQSQLSHWPVQIKLVPEQAAFLDGADLLIAADCTAYALPDFHQRFLKGRAVVIGCPKLDATDYTNKLTAILKNNRIKSLTLLRMEVPCCGGLLRAASQAIMNCGREIPFEVYTVGIQGDLKG